MLAVGVAVAVPGHFLLNEMYIKLNEIKFVACPVPSPSPHPSPRPRPFPFSKP